MDKVLLSDFNKAFKAFESAVSKGKVEQIINTEEKVVSVAKDLSMDGDDEPVRILDKAIH
jgi:hypothetical protein